MFGIAQEKHERERWNVETVASLEELTDILPMCVSLLTKIFRSDETFCRERLVEIIRQGGKIYSVRSVSKEMIVGLAALYTPLPGDSVYDTIKKIGDIRFGMGVVAPKYRSRGVYRALNEERVSHVIDNWLGSIEFDTQNPRTEAGVAAVLRERVESKKLKSFDLKRIKGQRTNQKSDALKHILPLGNPDIDRHYESLDRAKGEYFRLAFTLEY